MESIAVIDRKNISITGKRQVTIPLRFFEALGFEREAECIMLEDAILLRPHRNESGGELAEQILADLIAQGFSGAELLKQFREARKKIRPAVERMLDEAKNAARGQSKAYSYADVFGK